MRTKKFTGMMMAVCLAAVVATGCGKKEVTEDRATEGSMTEIMSNTESEVSKSRMSDTGSVVEEESSDMTEKEEEKEKSSEKKEENTASEKKDEKMASEKKEEKTVPEKKDMKKEDEKKDRKKGQDTTSDGKEEKKVSEMKKEEPKKEEPKKEEPKKEEPVAEAPKTVYKDGTFTGSGKGYEDRITTVSVTIKADKIVSIAVDASGDDEPYISLAKEEVIANILKSGNPQVSAVAGATKSSNGIMQAVADALSKAKN